VLNYEKEITAKIAPFTDVPIIFTSAKEKQRIFKAMEKALEVYDSRRRRITTAKLNEVMLKEVEHYKPPMVRGNNVRIKFVMQLPTFIPSFAFYSNHPNDIKGPYKRFLENKIREHFNFQGVPIRLFFRKK